MNGFIPRVTKVASDSIKFDNYKNLSLYRVDSGCQFLGWVARCEYQGGGIEWMARTRDGATSTRKLTTKTEAVDLLDRAYDLFCSFNTYKTPWYDVDSKLNQKVA